MPSKRAARIWTLAVLSVALCAIGAYCVTVSAHRILWSDELFGWMLLTDPSLGHMIASWRAGADGGGIVFYLLGRVWLEVLGHSEIAFRAFSATGCFLAFCCAWFALRRYYRPEWTALALFLTWFGSHTILWQMVQTRFYGMLLAATAFALYATVRSAQESSDGQGQGRTTLAIAFVAQLLLVGCHPLGMMYGAILLVSAAANDWMARRRRLLFYAASLLPWTVVLFSLEAMRSTAAVGKPYFWTTTPISDDLMAMYTPDALPFLLTVALTAVGVLLLSGDRLAAMRSGVSARRDVLLPALLLALVPVGMWVDSQHGTSIFVDRYMVPFTLGIAVLGTELLTHLGADLFTHVRTPRLERPVWVKLGAAAVAAWLLFCVGQDSIVAYPQTIILPSFDFTAKLAERLPRGLPVVFERVDSFDVMLFRHPDLPLLYLLDWETTIDPEAPRGLVSGHHEMENWKRSGYFSRSILESKEFLATTNDFIVVAGGGSVWFKRRILADPRWEATQIDTYTAGYWSASLWRVHRRRP